LKWLHVAWGKRHYLLADDQLGDFVRAINDQSEPRSEVHGSFLLHDGDWKLPATGAPPLPPEWESLLRPQPVSARVVAVEKGGIVRLDSGTTAGLTLGLPLTLMSPQQTRSVRLAWGTVVEATQAAARVKITLGDKVRPGDLVGTKLW
jgi:hypothetical protein